MKKALSILLTILTIISAAYSCTICAFAETTTRYWEPKHGFQDSKGYVNGEPTDGISLMAVPDTEYCEITYSKEGTVTKWEFPTLTENKDYTIIAQSNNSITVLWTNEDQGAPYINAIVNFKDTAIQETTTAKNTQTNKNATAKNESDVNETTAAETTTEPETTTVITIENNNNNSSYDIIIIGGIVAIIVCGAIIAMFIKKKIKRS